MPPSGPKYSDLRKVHFEQPDDDDAEGQIHQYQPPPKHGRWWLGYTMFILLGISVFFNGMQYINTLLDATKHVPHDIDDICSAHTSEYREYARSRTRSTLTCDKQLRPSSRMSRSGTRRRGSTTPF